MKNEKRGVSILTVVGRCHFSSNGSFTRRPAHWSFFQKFMFWALPSLALILMATSTTKMKKPIVAMHWFRKGLRLHDNPGLVRSSQEHVTKLYPVYVLDGDCYQIKHCTALRGNFLVECVQDLDANLRKNGSRLYVRSGDPVEVLPQLWNKWGVTHLTFEEDETGEPYAKERDEKVLEEAKKSGIEVETFASETLHPLQTYVNKSGSAVPNTMGSFQTLFGRVGKIPLPLEAPAAYPPSDDQGNSNMHPPKVATDLPWPRNIPPSKVSPIWNVENCRNLTPNCSWRRKMGAEIASQESYRTT